MIWLAIHIVAMSLFASGDAAAMPLLTDLARVLQRIANPEPDAFRLISSMRVPWSHLALYFATLLLALGIAAFVLNRKELTYASE